MNLNLINLDCTQWSKADWNDAYNQYCRHNMFGEKTKREYWDFVHERHNALKTATQSLNSEAINKWINGFKNAAIWAKEHQCDMNGAQIDAAVPKDINERLNQIENITCDNAYKLDTIVSRIKRN